MDVHKENIKLIKDLADCGIISSICSKNNLDIVIAKLSEIGLLDYFVFTSVNWEPKGQRISEMISDMGLRAANVLFIDDNVVNLQEAKFYSPELMISMPDVIPDLIDYISKEPKTDIEHNRLHQYKVLEKKKEEQKSTSNNLEFLYNSDTQVEIIYDCLPELERIHELILRTNQLNYTKKRIGLGELRDLISNPNVKSGYVKVHDKFGDYGIVGFFAVENYRCIHFLFSCRTIGQGVEQFTYATLGYPSLDTVGEVIVNVDQSKAPAWINSNSQTFAHNIDNTTVSANVKILFKGPCDMMVVSSYLNMGNGIFTEFSYVSDDNKWIEQHNHSTHIAQLLTLSHAEKELILDDCCFADSKMFDSKIFDSDIDLIILSTLPELNLGVYQNRENNIKVVFGESCYPLTDPNNYDTYIKGEIFTAYNHFTREWLDEFSLNYKFLGRITNDEYIDNIRLILSHISKKATLCLVLGVEVPDNNNTQPAYLNRHLLHRELNDKIREFAKHEKRIHLIDTNDFVKSQKDFTNNINHYQKSVYYKMAMRISDVVNMQTQCKVSRKKRIVLIADNCSTIFMKYFKKESLIYKIGRKIYRRIKR